MTNKQPEIEKAKELVDKLDSDFSTLKQALTQSQSDLTHTLRETRMYMFKDIRKACEDAGLSHDQWIAVEAELQAQFDRFFEDHDCHASPEDGCTECEKQLDDMDDEWALREREDFDRAVSTHESNYMDRVAG